MTAPPAPTAQTSLVLAPHTPRRFAVVLLVIAVHAPSCRTMIAPPSPTANTSLASTAHTAPSSVVDGIGADSTHHIPAGHVEPASGAPPASAAEASTSASTRAASAPIAS